MTNVYDLSEKVKQLWNEWEFRALILLSLSLQIFLVFFGKKRKHVAAAWLRNFIWLAYLSAEWVATLCMGILARIQGGTETNCANPNPDFVPAFWAATLLVHLGGPDAITAYSVEDNQLWLRQLLQLVTQVAVAFYALLRSWWSKDPLIFVAVPVFVSGVIKYGERIWALRSASFDNAVLHEEVQRLSQQLDEKFPSAALLDMSVEDINRALGFHRIASQVVHLHEAHLLFQISKMLFTDYMLPFSTHMTSYLILSSKNAAEAFRLIEVELGFMFDALYTKVITGLCWQGFLLRAISCSSSIAALLAFARMTINCHAYSTTNIVVSYCLLVGAVLHEIYSVVFLLFSDWVMLWLSKQHKPWATAVCQAIVSSNQKWPFNRYDHKKWRGTMAQQDRISDENTRVKMRLKQFLRIKDFPSWEKVDMQLKEAIFNYLLQKRLRFSHYMPLPDPGMNNLNEILAERGDQVLRTEGCLEGEFRQSTVDADFRESLLLWYIATDICYYDDSRTNGSYVDPNARISKSLSNYMQYVLTDYPLMLPKMIQGERRAINSSRVISEIRWAWRSGISTPTLWHSEEFLREIKWISPEENSIASAGCKLAKSLQDLGKERGKERKWKMISEVWVEMLTYTAVRCNWQEHAKTLTRGGELLTHVCLLMAHLGLSEQCVT